MKNKLLAFFAVALCALCLPLCACKNDDTSNFPKNNLSNETTTLVIYFSRTGAVAEVAKTIADDLDADIYRIEPVTPYPTSDAQLESIVHDEMNNNERPSIKNNITDLSKYETIFVGFPVWLDNLPNIILSFVESVDLGEKTIVPFCTHSGSGTGSALVTLRSAVSDNRFLNEFAVAESSATSEQTKQQIELWLEQII